MAHGESLSRGRPAEVTLINTAELSRRTPFSYENNRRPFIPPLFSLAPIVPHVFLGVPVQSIDAWPQQRPFVFTVSLRLLRSSPRLHQRGSCQLSLIFHPTGSSRSGDLPDDATGCVLTKAAPCSSAPCSSQRPPPRVLTFCSSSCAHCLNVDMIHFIFGAC